MSYSTLVSNATGKRFNLPIRLTDAKGNQYYRDVKILPYALNQTLIFDSEEQYKKWVNEYSEYVSGKESIIKLEKTSGHALEKQNKKLEKEFSDKMESDKSAMDNKDKELEIETKVEKTAKPDKEDKK
ncbi:hypothetical protein [Brachyspira innocens]|uniref:hypothetical protein n=1 Tax=Brachyspira innocens TaxID=13264 RepID=UPI0026ED2E13|nr:hypothetical protein [Brachyspira innocens]